jgi:hypothetical protein
VTTLAKWERLAITTLYDAAIQLEAFHAIKLSWRWNSPTTGVLSLQMERAGLAIMQVVSFLQLAHGLLRNPLSVILEGMRDELLIQLRRDLLLEMGL